MRIFARKTYEFDLDGRKFVTRPLEFMDLPDVVEKTLLFRLAVADGSIEVLDTARKQKQAEKGEKKPVKAEKAPEAPEQSKE